VQIGPPQPNSACLFTCRGDYKNLITEYAENLRERRRHFNVLAQSEFPPVPAGVDI
jgi:hypothetical protein